ncbi:MAG: UDP-3-O-(3-hydroxymyristoyl)glucosamine N-acyltransferase [Candidatus Eremiobacteraeota bacterium]|nr:UDP-3-O-(3-hydroxymyristoyl)glucosamine N-acyltransferase [Candidatus Eremiobacteraeota bacterium]
MLGTLAELAQRVNGRVIGDGTIVIARVSAIDEAGHDALTFATGERYLQTALASSAAAVIVDEALTTSLDATIGKPLLVVASARVALAQLLRSFTPPTPRGPFQHPSAVVEPSATIGAEVFIGALCYVGPGSAVGAGTILGTGVIIGAQARIGAECRLFSRATVMDRCTLGDRVTLHPGCVIGSDGFGYVFLDDHFESIPQIGDVVLEDDVEVGANTCIDRAQTGSTRIGRGSKIDNLCQIGHNCRIGEHSAFAAQTGLAGSTTIGSYTQVGGQSGFRGHITIGSRVKIAAGSAVWGDIPDDSFVSGRPARPHREELKREVMVRSLPKLVARVEALENRAPGEK